MSNTDPHAGSGGSYIQNPDGTRELVERTGFKPESAAPGKPEPIIEDAPTDPEKLRK